MNIWNITKEAIAKLPEPNALSPQFIDMPVMTNALEVKVMEGEVKNPGFVIIRFQKVKVGEDWIWVQIGVSDYRFLQEFRIVNSK